MAKYLINCSGYSTIVDGNTFAEALMNYLENWTTKGLQVEGIYKFEKSEKIY